MMLPRGSLMVSARLSIKWLSGAVTWFVCVGRTDVQTRRRIGFVNWNYRIVRRVVNGGEDECRIHEVYYDDDPGEMMMWSKRPAYPQGDSVEDVIGTLKLMMLATEHPVLEQADMPGGHPEGESDS